MLSFTQVVLADGRVATCTPNKTVIEDNGPSETIHDGKLFWALRGGGGSTFGVVVHYVQKLHLTKSSYVSGFMKVTLNNNETDRAIMKKSMEAYTEFVKSTPAYWAASIGIYPTAIFLRFTKFGSWDGNTESEVKPLLDFKDLYDQLAAFTLANLSSSAAVAVSDDVLKTRQYQLGAMIQSEENNATGVWDFLLQTMLETRARNVTFGCSFSRLGGKEQYNKNLS